jgi:EAL domain-containing protein (putative c-di-GMP-specific phosphodiesterase class I)
MEYKDIKRSFDGETERFRRGRDDLYRIALGDKSLTLYCALNPDSIDANVYPHEALDKKTDLYKYTRVVLTLTDEKSLKNAIELVRLTADIRQIPKLNVIVPVAYAEKYPVNTGAVLKGDEEIPPVEGAYMTSEYDDIYGELTARFVSELDEKAAEETDEPSMMCDSIDLDTSTDVEDSADEEEPHETGAEKLQNRRQTAKNIRAAIALAEPIVYFYDVSLDKNNEVSYVNMQQVLNDKFLGKLLNIHYFAIAEGSERIEDLNFLALSAAKEICDANPKLNFAIQISCRLLIKPYTLSKLIKDGQTENKNLIMAFDCALLDALGDKAISALKALKASGIQLMADNCEQGGMKALTAYGMDYIRFDCRYYNAANIKEVSYLKLVTGYCASNGITTSAQYCDSQKDAYFMLSHGIVTIQGRAIGEPKRLLHAAMKERKKLAVVGG